MLKCGIVGVLVVSVLQCIKATDAKCGITPKPDFKVPGRRISEEKCLEYNWERKNIDKCSNETANTNYPFMGIVALRDEDEKEDFQCAAFLVSPKFALTAAVCVSQSFQKPVYVRFGNSNFNAMPRVDAKIKRTFVHPSFKKSYRAFDIGLVEFEEALPLSKSIQPVCLWSRSSLDTSDAIAPGWGTEFPEKTVGANLKEMIVKVIDAETCEVVYKDIFSRKWKQLEDHQFCAKESNGVQLCQGSRGVPLVAPAKLDEEEMPHAFAITSFRVACRSRPDYPGSGHTLYTKVASFIDWIEQTVWPVEKEL